MPPPAKPVTALSQVQRRPLAALNRGVSLTAPSQEGDSLFVPNDADDERRWEEPEYDNEETEDLLGWDASGEMNSGSGPTLRDTVSQIPPARAAQYDDAEYVGLAATQRLSQIHGLFD